MSWIDGHKDEEDVCGSRCLPERGKIPSAAQNTSCQQPVTVDASKMRWIKIHGHWTLDQNTWTIDI